VMARVSNRRLSSRTIDVGNGVCVAVALGLVGDDGV
jgi:hypothetical protein